MFRLIPLPEHTFSDKPQRSRAHTLGSEALTRETIKGCLKAGSMLRLQDNILNAVRLKKVRALLNLIPRDLIV